LSGQRDGRTLARIGIALGGLVAVLSIAQLFLPDAGVGFVTGIVVYLIVWWMVFFCVLPLRVQSQQEMGDIEPGSEPGAPVDPQLGYKFKLTSTIAAGIWLVYFVVFEFGLLSLDMFPYGPALTPVQ
jgi:predicted secreted protein